MDERRTDQLTDTWSYRDDVSRMLDGTAIDGYDVEATDGKIGTIDEHTAEPAAGYLLVDTGFWIFGKKRIVPAGVVKQVNHEQRTVFVNMTKDDIKAAPDYDEATRTGTDADWYRTTNRDYYDPFAR